MKLKHFQSQSLGKLIKLITIYAVIMNASFTFSLVKFVVNNIATGKTVVVDKFRS